jgi:hypothetical protein
MCLRRPILSAMFDFAVAAAILFSGQLPTAAATGQAMKRANAAKAP